MNQIVAEDPPVRTNVVDDTWSAEFFRLRGWQSKKTAQADLQQQLLPEIGKQLEQARKQNTQAWAERKPMAQSLAGDKSLKAGKEFQKYIAALADYEKLAPPAPRPVRPVRPEGIKPNDETGAYESWLGKDTEWAKAEELWRASDQERARVIGALRGAAQGYIDHYTNDHSKGQKQDEQNLRKFNQCTATLAELAKLAEGDRKAAVLSKMQSLPWDSETQMLASSLKAELDFRSLDIPPQENRGGETETDGINRAEQLGEPGVNNSFWVNKEGGTKGETVKSFIFKPMEKKSPNGIPPFGQAAREALAGRMADVLNGMLGIDFGVPETQLITVAKERFPTPPSKNTGFQPPQEGDVVGSLQQFAPTDGAVGGLPRGARAKVPARRCQELSLLDTIMGNTDRHANNFLMKTGEDANDLVPIDHGLSFPEDNNCLNQLGQPKNCLITFAGAHEPFSKDMIEKIERLDPELLKQALAGETRTIGTVHPSTKGTLGDKALEGAKRRTMFIKLACRRLSPAALQTAIAANNAALFPDPPLDGKAFETLANTVIEEAERTQDLLKQYYTMPEEERRLVDQWAKDVRWDFDEVPDKGMLLAAFSQGMAPPKREAPADGTEPGDKALQKAMLTAFPMANVPKDIPKWQSLIRLVGKTDPESVIQDVRAILGKMGSSASGQVNLIGGSMSSGKGMQVCLDLVVPGKALLAAMAVDKEALAAGMQAQMLKRKYTWLMSVLDTMESNRKDALAERARTCHDTNDVNGFNALVVTVCEILQDSWETKLRPCREKISQARQSMKTDEQSTGEDKARKVQKAARLLGSVESHLAARNFKRAEDDYQNLLDGVNDLS